MPVRKLAWFSLMLSLVFVASVRPARAAQTGPMYWICSNTRVQTANTIYVSEVTGPFGQRMNNGYTADKLGAEFHTFLLSKYKLPPGPMSYCSGFESEAKARESVKNMTKFSPNAKLVETGWKSSVSPEAAAAAAQAPTPPLLGYCWLITPDYTTYISRTAVYDRGNIQGVENDYAAFILKTYGVRQGARCMGARSQAEIAESHQQTMADLKRMTKVTMKFVELDWTPAAKSAASTPAPAAPPPTAPPSRSGSAAAVTPPVAAPSVVAPPVAAPAKPAAAQAADTYSYCYAYGTAQGPGNGKSRKQHYYVAPVFARAAADRPDGDWQKFIRAAHADEAFNASCSPAEPRAAADKKRTDQMASMGKLANFETVLVDWKR